MRTIIIDCLFISNDLDNIYSNKNSLEIIYDYSKKNGFDRYILLQNGLVTKCPEGIKNIILEIFTPYSIITTILEESKNSNTIVIFNGGNPFYDYDFIEKMIAHHEKYLADYTFQTGYPDGLLPTIVRKEALNEMSKLVEKDTNITTDYLYSAISKDINSYDIETFMCEYDLRISRVRFGANDKGERTFTEAIYNNFKDGFSYKDIAKYIYENPDKLYSIPYMLGVELNRYSDIRSIYNINGLDDNSLELDFESFKKVIIKMKKINPVYNLLLTGVAEPLKYSKITELIELTSENGINIVIETYGVDIDNNFLEKLKSIKKEKITFVIKLDAYSKEIYDKINLGGNFDKAINSYKILKENGFKVYRSIVRMNENEEDIEKYVRNKDVENLIIKKYSTYCDKLIDRKVVDLSPLDRIPCFHLRREIFINNDGTYSFCQYAFDDIIGNIKDDEIEMIIEKLKDKYKENALKHYTPFCEKCDDYYIFNF